MLGEAGNLRVCLLGELFGRLQDQAHWLVGLALDGSRLGPALALRRNEGVGPRLRDADKADPLRWEAK